MREVLGIFFKRNQKRKATGESVFHVSEKTPRWGGGKKKRRLKLTRGETNAQERRVLSHFH